MLMERLGLRRESHPTSERKGLPNSKNPLKKVNGLQPYALARRLFQGGRPKLV